MDAVATISTSTTRQEPQYSGTGSSTDSRAFDDMLRNAAKDEPAAERPAPRSRDAAPVREEPVRRTQPARSHPADTAASSKDGGGKQGASKAATATTVATDAPAETGTADQPAAETTDTVTLSADDSAKPADTTVAIAVDPAPVDLALANLIVAPPVVRAGAVQTDLIAAPLLPQAEAAPTAPQADSQPVAAAVIASAAPTTAAATTAAPTAPAAPAEATPDPTAAATTAAPDQATVVAAAAPADTAKPKAAAKTTASAAASAVADLLPSLKAAPADTTAPAPAAQPAAAQADAAAAATATTTTAAAATTTVADPLAKPAAKAAPATGNAEAAPSEVTERRQAHAAERGTAEGVETASQPAAANNTTAAAKPVVPQQTAAVETGAVATAPAVAGGNVAAPGQQHVQNNVPATQTVLTAVPHSPAVAASAIAQVGFHLQRAGGGEGSQALTINLTPEELGSIEVKLDIGRDGVVHAHVIADRSDTLDMMKSDQRGLERALENAGLTTDGGSLSFDLRGGNDAQNGRYGSQSAQGGDANGGDTAADIEMAIVNQPIVADGRVNVKV